VTAITLDQAESIIDAILQRGAQLPALERDRGRAGLQSEGVQERRRIVDDPVRDGLRQSLCGAVAWSQLETRARAGAGTSDLHALSHAASGDQIFPEGGGMLVRDDSGEVIGAVGVTGDTEDRDEELAVHGIHAAGLKTDADCTGIGRQVGLPKPR
jgi:hypothetical protein